MPQEGLKGLIVNKANGIAFNNGNSEAPNTGDNAQLQAKMLKFQ
jgi:hypothetical protein